MQISPYDGLFYLSQATSLEELTLTFEKIMAKYGFDLFAVQSTTPEIKKRNAQPNYLCNFSKIWSDHYYESKYYEIDPVISLGKQKREPYLWDKLWKNVEMTSKQREFFDEADEFNVSAGIGLPIFELNNEPGIVSLVSSFCNQKDVEKILKKDHLAISLLAVSFHNAANKFFEQRPALDAPNLTNREKECLKWAARGKTDNVIGDILNISTRTVNHHMQNSYAKLNCVSREQAVVKAFIMKIISL